MELEAQLQEELDTNFEDLEGDAPVDDEDAEDEEVEANPEPIDVSYFIKPSLNKKFITSSSPMNFQESLFKSKWDSDPKEDRLGE